MANSFFEAMAIRSAGSYLFDKNRVGAAVIHYDSNMGFRAKTPSST